MGGKFVREWIYVWLSPFTIHLKPSQHCQLVIVQYKIKSLKNGYLFNEWVNACMSLVTLPFQWHQSPLSVTLKPFFLHPRVLDRVTLTPSKVHCTSHTYSPILFFFFLHNVYLFFKRFFWMLTIFKVFIEFVTTLLLFYVLVFWLRTTSLASRPGIGPTPLALGSKILISGPPEKSWFPNAWGRCRVLWVLELIQLRK